MKNATPGVSTIQDLGAGALSGILKASTGAIVAATAGVDYVVPAALSAYALDSAAAHLAGTETFTGNKTATGSWTFNQAIVVANGGGIIGSGAAVFSLGDSNDTVNLAGGVLTVNAVAGVAYTFAGFPFYVGSSLPGSENAWWEVHGDDVRPLAALYTHSGTVVVNVSAAGYATFELPITASNGVSIPDGTGVAWPDWLIYEIGGSLYVRDLVNGVMAMKFANGLTPRAEALGDMTVAGPLGVNGAAPPAKPTIAGSRSAALAAIVEQMLTALGDATGVGFWTDGTTS